MDIAVELVAVAPPSQANQPPLKPIPDLVRVMHNEGEGRFVATATQIVYPRWFNVTVIALMLLGVGTFFFLIFQALLAILSVTGLI